MADKVTIPRGSAVPEVTAGLVLHTVQAMSKYLGAVGVGRRWEGPVPAPPPLTVNDPHLPPSHPTPGLRGEGWNVAVSGGESVPAAVGEGHNVRRHGGLLGTVRGGQERRERTKGKTRE